MLGFGRRKTRRRGQVHPRFLRKKREEGWFGDGLCAATALEPTRDHLTLCHTDSPVNSGSIRVRGVEAAARPMGRSSPFPCDLTLSSYTTRRTVSRNGQAQVPLSMCINASRRVQSGFKRNAREVPALGQQERRSLHTHERNGNIRNKRA